MSARVLLARSGEVLDGVGASCAVAADRIGLARSLAVSREGGCKKLREEGRCRMCLRASAIRRLTRHHVVPRSWFRDRPRLACLQHADANIVPLCQPCHAEVERPGDHARVELRRLLGSAEVAFALRVAGERWLESRYPSRTASASLAGARVQARRRARESRAL